MKVEGETERERDSSWQKMPVSEVTKMKSRRRQKEETLINRRTTNGWSQAYIRCFVRFKLRIFIVIY